MSMIAHPEKGFVNGKFRNVGAVRAEGTDPSADHVNAPPVVPDLAYDGMTRAELDKLAEERGVDVSKASNKADVIVALKAAQA